jgi:hypothetical protein
VYISFPSLSDWAEVKMEFGRKHLRHCVNKVEDVIEGSVIMQHCDWTYDSGIKNQGSTFSGASTARPQFDFYCWCIIDRISLSMQAMYCSEH